MRIEEVTPEISEERVRQWHAVELAIADTPDYPLPADSAASLHAHALHPGDEPIARHAATLAIDDDDQVIGFTRSWAYHAQNRHLVDGFVAVAPGARRQGVGSQLLDHLVQVIRADGRTQLTLGAAAGSAGTAFCERKGAPVALVERHSVLDVTAVDWALVEKSAHAPAGYRLLTWDHEPPEELLSSLARAQESMDDAPKGDLAIERDTWTVEMIQALYALSAARGARRFVVAAVHEDTGEVAGFTELHIAAGILDYAEQGDTVVVPAHRGHGLGMAVKCAQLLRLRELAPQVQRISTWNADSNVHMLAVNIELGFEKAELWGMHQLSLK